MNKGYCETCREDVDVIIKDIKYCDLLRGVEYFYDGKKAECSKCTNEIYLSSINDYNLEKLYTQFRKINDIIELGKLNIIPDKYGVTPESLSIILGWEKDTFQRYIDGDLPTREHSDILKIIFTTPREYLRYLEKAKFEIDSHIYGYSIAITKINFPL